MFKREGERERREIDRIEKGFIYQKFAKEEGVTFCFSASILSSLSGA